MYDDDYYERHKNWFLQRTVSEPQDCENQYYEQRELPGNEKLQIT